MVMVFPKRVLTLLLVTSLLALAASCVESRHPLSDEKTSQVDQRLIGTWLPEGDAAAGHRVTRSVQTPNALDLLVTDANGKGNALLFTTTIQSKAYLSVKDLYDEGQKEGPLAYTIYQYQFLDNDTVQLRGMEPDVIARAIADKRLGGEIRVSQRKSKRLFGLIESRKLVEERTPIITDTPEGIARYLRAHADECYPAQTDSMLTFKRQK
jgi:hypothetical protein